MFLKYLKIYNFHGLIRRTDFHMGLNLIVDETRDHADATGNNVGKTTLLRLIDYCMGGDSKRIYTTADNVVNKEVRDYLQNTEVTVELCLVDSLADENSRRVTVRRNFLDRNRAIRMIDGEQVSERNFAPALQRAMWGMEADKPTFREIISHSMRINNLRLEQPLKTLKGCPTIVAYEALHLYLFGANQQDSKRKVELSDAIKTDRKYKSQLEQSASAGVLRTELASVERQIEKWMKQKSAYQLNPDFEQNLEELAAVKNTLSQLGVELNSLTLRQQLIKEAADDFCGMKSNVNDEQIAAIYQQAKAYNANLQRTFEELLHFHNGMLQHKADFITDELPELEREIAVCKDAIAGNRNREKALEQRLYLSISYESLDRLISNLSTSYQEKGRLEQSLSPIEKVERRIRNNEKALAVIDQDRFSEEFKAYVQGQLDKFNAHFSSISEQLYHERYAIGFEKITYQGKPYYKFHPCAADNFSTGKKQGEIACFDLAYVQFADEEEIPCLHFILNDKKELMDDKQLVGTATLVEQQGNVQYVASILHDKLPEALDQEKYFVLKLSQTSRLFRIEENL